MVFKYSFILHVHPQMCTVLWINLIIESGVWKIRHRHKSVTYRQTDRWTDRYTTLTCIYLIIVAVSKKKVFKASIISSVAFNNLYSCFIPIQQKKVAQVMPRLTCYMHACVHVVLIILIWIKVSKCAKIRNRYNQVPHLTQDTNGKVTNSQQTPQTRAKRTALSQQVTIKHI